MLKTALRRGGRMIAVTALATAFLGSTAGANDLPPAPAEADAQADASAQEQATATATAGAEVKTERQAQCKTVAVGRNASFNYFLATKQHRADASAAVQGDASLEVCYDLDVTVGATVNIALGQDATATATAAASAPPPNASDAENACVNGSVGLIGDAEATAVGTVRARVAASASAGAGALEQGASAGTADAGADGTGWLTVPVSLTPDSQAVNDGVVTGACLNSAGDLVDP